eukprot:2180228-Amphidinium_carterae.1
MEGGNSYFNFEPEAAHTMVPAGSALTFYSLRNFMSFSDIINGLQQQCELLHGKERHDGGLFAVPSSDDKGPTMNSKAIKSHKSL